jgi:hypothetical protein
VSSEIFNRLRAKYEGWYTTQRGQQADSAERDLLREFLEGISGKRTVLEAGSGSGHFAGWLAESGPHPLASNSKESPTNYAVDDNSPLPGLPGHGMCQRVSGGLHLRVRGRRQRRISPTSFISIRMNASTCGACEPECPWPPSLRSRPWRKIFKDDIALNHATTELLEQFKVATFQQKEYPTPEQVAANKRKWGWDPDS